MQAPRLKLAGRTLIAILGVAALALALYLQGRPSGVDREREASASGPADARFSYLAVQRSNRCDLQAAEIATYPRTARLQGSCCSPMDRAAYKDQLRALRDYDRVAAIPRDPYDISAGTVQRLLRYRDNVELDRTDRATYRRALELSSEGGPCCCHCWRWEAFAGLGQKLTMRDGWHAAELASLIDALDGCGGPRPEPRVRAH